jgi:hypothetical protein
MIGTGVFPIMKMSNFKRGDEFIIRHNGPLQRPSQLAVFCNPSSVETYV